MDDDAQISTALRASAPPPPRGDRRTRILVAARYRRRRRRVGLVAIVGAAVVLGLIFDSRGGDAGRGEGARVDGVESGEREISVPGIRRHLRLSATMQPTAAGRSFGVIPLANGSITAATLTRRDDGAVVAIVAMTTGPDTVEIAVSTIGTSRAFGHITGGVAFAVLPLPAWAPDVVLDVAALDRHGYTIESARVAPSLQPSTSCPSTPITVASPDGGRPTYLEARNAYLGAPVAIVCP